MYFYTADANTMAAESFQRKYNAMCLKWTYGHGMSRVDELNWIEVKWIEVRMIKIKLSYYF